MLGTIRFSCPEDQFRYESVNLVNHLPHVRVSAVQGARVRRMRTGTPAVILKSASSGEDRKAIAGDSKPTEFWAIHPPSDLIGFCPQFDSRGPVCIDFCFLKVRLVLRLLPKHSSDLKFWRLGRNFGRFSQSSEALALDNLGKSAHL